MFQLGGQALFLSTADLQIGRGEPIADTARALSRYLDGLMIRTYAHETVEELACGITQGFDGFVGDEADRLLAERDQGRVGP